MVKTFKQIPSLYRLIVSAPIEALRELWLTSDDGCHAHQVSLVKWPDDLADVAVGAACRRQLLDIAADLSRESALPLECHAERLLKLADGAGVVALAEVVNRWAEEGRPAAFDALRDDFGRAVWLYLRAPRRFEAAENLYYAEHYRQTPRLYEAFRVVGIAAAFHWSATGKQALEAQIRQHFAQAEGCQIDHIHTSKMAANGHKVEAQLLAIRFAGSSAGVGPICGGQHDARYFRSAVDATLFYTSDEQCIEVSAETSGLRRQLAAIFAETVLHCDLSLHPLALNCYDFARFARRYALELPQIDGFDIEYAGVIEADVKTQDLQQRLQFQVRVGEDFDRALDAALGHDNLFRRAGAVVRVVIVVRYRVAGDWQQRYLKIVLEAPNRCSLHSYHDPRERELGFALLAQWGLADTARAPAACEAEGVFPALLELYDHEVDTIGGRWLEGRDLDRQRLVEGGFLRLSGRRLAEDDEGGRSGWYGGALQKSAIQPLIEEFFEIRRECVEERLIKAMRADLRHSAGPHPSPYLRCLGYLAVDGEAMPVYLGRRLHVPEVIYACDRLLRGPDIGEGVVLSPALVGPEFLGMSVVIPIFGLLVSEAAAPRLDVERLRFEFRRRRGMVRRPEQVEFIRDGNQSATLRIPGKAPLHLLGENQVLIMQRLVDAYRAGRSAVCTKELLDGTGVRSPSQAFTRWKEVIEGMYVGRPPGVQRGSWQLLA